MQEIYSAQDDTLGYEWNEFHVYRDEDYAYRVDRQTGCSCSMYEPMPEQCTPLDKGGVIHDFTKWGSCLSPQIKTRELERLLKKLST